MKKIACLLCALLLLAWPFAAMAQAAAVPAVSIDITGLVTALIGVLATVITAYLTPWLKAKLGEERYRAAQVVIKAGVQAAEQIFGRGYGKQKLEYVKRYLESHGISYDVDQIEAAVYELGREVLYAEDADFEDDDGVDEDEDDQGM